MNNEKYETKEDYNLKKKGINLNTIIVMIT